MRAFTLWLCICAGLNCAGWTLSALHMLNAYGYSAALALGVIVWFVAWRRIRAPLLPEFRASCLRRRFGRGFPMAFLGLALMAFLGGALYAPSNYDALAYRLPRVLHWLAANHWHWIHTSFERLNDRCCGIEWVSAPVLALCGNTRPLFLINFISFLLLPGLVFSVFTRLGVRPRVAWHWMWLAPTGYCFLLQAGGIGNDLFGALFALGAVDFALRAWNGGGFAAVSFTVVSAGLMTAVKMNNLPLLLPCAVALLPSLKLLLRHPFATVGVVVVGLGASALPTIYFNWKTEGDWSGARLSDGSVKYAIAYRTAANIVSLTQQNLEPPIFPIADRWNRAVKGHLPPPLAHKLEALIESPGCWFPLPQMQIEEDAGLGFGLSFLLVATGVALILRRGQAQAPPRPANSWTAAVRWSALVAFVALLTQSNLSTIGRLFAAFYLLPCPIILSLAGNEELVKRTWWRSLAWLTFLMGAGLLVISPARPLFPRDLLLDQLRAREGAHPGFVRLDDVYSVYRDRPAAFAPAVSALPADTKVVGYIGFDRPEATLWQPFGSRRIVHVCPEDRSVDLKAAGVTYIWVDTDEFGTRFHCPFDQWLVAMNAVVVRELPLRLRAAHPAGPWSLVQLR